MRCGMKLKKPRNTPSVDTLFIYSEPSEQTVQKTFVFGKAGLTNSC